MALVLVRLFLLVGPLGSLNLVGVALGLGMTVFYDAFLFFVEEWLADIPSNTITVYVEAIVANLLTAVYLFLYRLAAGNANWMGDYRLHRSVYHGAGALPIRLLGKSDRQR
ncbi:MAG: hypothetical protein WEA61_05320 [Anaerolineales bacterium]